MKSRKQKVFVALAVFVAGGFLGWVIVTRQAERSGLAAATKALRLAELGWPKEEARPGPPPGETSPTNAEAKAPTLAVPKGDKSPVKLVKPDNQTPRPGAQSGQGKRRGKEPIQDPLARAALAYVGVDWEAEMYWCEAINDPNLKPQERQDLIEDLNEDGLSDPKHPTIEDLPIIVSRLRLIELLAPEGMDKVNADAFLEAYKDLTNLVMGGGEPVR